MKITDIQFFPLRCPLPEPIVFSLGKITHRNFGIVKIITDEGIVGWGETFVNFPSWALKERQATIEYGVKPLVIGENPLDPEQVTQKLISFLHKLGLQWGAKGCMYQAISGANIALWDIKGKVEAMPVYRLLGGESKPIPLYATGVNLSNMEQYISEGYQAVKFRVGFNPVSDVDLIKEARAKAGNRAKVYVDVNQSWDKSEALEMALKMEDAGASWIEEPTYCEDLEMMAKISEKLTIPLAAGENYFGVHDFNQALAFRAIDIGMPDITRVGGFGEMIKVCALLQEKKLPYSPHHFGSDIGFVASLHFLCAVPGAVEMLRDISQVILKEGVLNEKVKIVNGFAFVPEAPGLGISINEDLLVKYLA